MEEIRKDLHPKKTNPIDRSNKISQLFFCWLLPYFVKGYKRELTEDDIYQHRKQHDSGTLGDKLERTWNYQVKIKKNPSLLIALCNVFLPEFLFFCLLEIFSEAMRISQPLLVSNLLSYYDDNAASENVQATYMYAGLIILIAMVSTVLMQKSLKLSKTALAETTVGQMVNLLSNDVSRFDQATTLIHFLVIAPVEIIVVMFLCYNNIGWTGLMGTIFLLAAIPIQFYLGKKICQFRLATAIRTDERVRLMNEIIAGIQVIKMYTWEKPFAALVNTTRLREIKFIRYTSAMRAIMMSCFTVFNRSPIFFCILTYTLTGNRLVSSYAYTMISFYRMLVSVTIFFPIAITQISEMIVSAKRIRQFLLYEELLSNEHTNGYINQDIDNEALKVVKTVNSEQYKKVGIHLKDVSAKWLTSLTENNLDSIKLDIQSEELVAVVGPVGSGKSTLLHVILKELPPTEGTVEVFGTVSYASQEPWLFGGSIRQNILFGQEYDEKKYKEVVKVCALERDFILFPHGDRTLAGERGVSLSGGQRARINLARAVYKDADIYLLDDPLSAVDTQVGKQLFEDCICGYLNRKCVILITHQLQYLKHVKRLLLFHDGHVQVSGSYEDLKSSDSDYTKMLKEIEEEEDEIRRKSKITEKAIEDEKTQEIQTLAREEKGAGKISWHVYKNYILAGGHWSRCFGLAIIFIAAQVFDSLTEYFVTFWVNVEQKRNINQVNEISSNISEPISSWWLDPVFDGNYTVVYYSILFCITIIAIFTKSFSYFHWSVTAAANLHNNMFKNIVNSPMLFFNTNPMGRILNRFSRDIGAVDETLPLSIIDTFQIGLAALAIALIVCSLSPYMLIPTLIISIIFYLMRVVYLATSRDVKRLEAINRSPIYTHLTASLQGLTTIRAFKAEDILKIEFDNYQNLHSAAFFMFMGASHTFGFWLDFICGLYIALAIIFLLFVNSESLGGNIGLGLTQAMGLTGMFQWGMKQWCELENQMTSVERVQEYADLKPEQDENVQEPSKDWPQHGKIEFRNMCLSYSKQNPPVLKNLSFLIESKEKIGIVGRTGAGKSSLIQALFRLAYVDGSILIDDVNTKSISLNKLRSKISIIPQEPVLFSSTLRKNLDPFDEFNDDELWNALQEVELKSVVEDLPACLDNRMSEGGSNFSVGQRQLVCLARAIVRKNKILVLDEATANIDHHTDELIQDTIRIKFADCTVLTIAHRLNTIMDSDKVLVMDSGQVAEFDHPYLLLQSEKGIFHSLIMNTGASTAKILTAIAEGTYKNKYQHQT